MAKDQDEKRYFLLEHDCTGKLVIDSEHFLKMKTISKEFYCPNCGSLMFIVDALKRFLSEYQEITKRLANNDSTIRETTLDELNAISSYPKITVTPH